MSKATIERLLSGDHRSILERLITGTETGQRMIQELEGDRTQERRDLVSELATLNAASSAEIAEAGRQLQAAAAARAETQKILDRVSTDEAAARHVLARESARYSRDRARIQERLLQLTDPQIIEFRDELSKEINLCRFPRTSLSGTSKAQEALQKAVQVRMRGLKAALEEVGRLAFEPLDAVDIGEHISSIRQSLPPDPGGVTGSMVGTNQLR